MLSGEGHAGEWWKTTIVLISKKSNFARAAPIFFYISLPLFCTTTTWNFQKLLSYTLYTFFCRTCSRCSLFFTAAHFHLALVATSISHFVTAATKFSCSSNKKMSPLFFISCSRPPALSPFFSLSFAGLLPAFSFSLSFSCSIFQICGHDN